MNQEINKLIKDYAAVYQRFENFQNNDDNQVNVLPKLPKGDQKTGVIGEYYAKLFYENQKDVKSVKYGPMGASYDLVVTLNEGIKKIQVKCVSAHSKTKTIAPINMEEKDNKYPFDELFLIYLDSNLVPKGVYVNSFEGLKKRYLQNRKHKDEGSLKKISGAKMKYPEHSGSRYIDWSKEVTSGFNFLKTQQSVFQEPKKTQKSIFKLKKAQYEEGAILALQNSENLFQITQYCLETGLFGNGLSILITSMEELAKAAYLKLKAHDTELVIQELDDLFKSHKTKHVVSVRLFLPVIYDRFNSMPEQNRKNFALFLIISTVVVMLFWTKGKKLSFEEIRQKGYYMNYDDKNESWHAPQNYSDSASLDIYLKIAHSIFKTVKNDLFSKKLSFHELDAYVKKLGDENLTFNKRYVQVMNSLNSK
jgi:AbiV family abortive infection protein